MDNETQRRVELEVQIARDERAYQRGMLDVREQAPLLHFRCHTGPAFTADTLLSGMHKVSENKAYQMLQAIEETEILLRHMAQHHRSLGAPGGPGPGAGATQPPHE
ncbi:hypothetical protein [Deinococcus hohokamensis]|uniref:Uncharacterized protein n=1 Tax=Deinococcus hohokamensis TaxID=309883 RepID=A0ABV9IAY4_9DEIO